MPLPFSYPPAAPAWLAAWPTDAEVAAGFSSGIQEYAWRVIQQARPSELRWSPDSLTASFSGQRPSWRLVEGTWRRACTCGYKEVGRCAHTYALARLFQQVLRQEKWKPGTGGAAPHPAAPEPEPTPSPEPAAAVVVVPAAPPPPAATSGPPASLAGFFISDPGPEAPPVRRVVPGGGLIRNAGALRDRGELLRFGDQPPPPTVSHTNEKLDVEADMHFKPGEIGLRFYRNVDGRREAPLGMQSLMNLALRVSDNRNPSPGWSAIDRRFLGWLIQNLRKHLALKQRLNVMNLTTAEFDRWLDFWRDVPSRFIERRSQKCMAARSPATFHVELETDGDQVAIAAIITAPNGGRHRVHEVFNLLAAGKKNMVLDGQLLDFTPPISWQMLGDVFGHKTPRLPRRLVPQHLPTILEGRLDLLEGANITRREVIRPVQLQLQTDGADLRLLASIGDNPVFADSEVAATGQITPQGGNWLVTLAVSPVWPGLRQFLRSLPLVRENDGWMRLPGDPANIEKLLAAWPGLPPEVQTSVPPALQGLLGGAIALQPEIALREKHNYVDLHVTWVGADVRLSAGELKEAVAGGRSIYRTPSGGWLHLDLQTLAQRQAALAEAGVTEAGGQRLFRHEAKNVLEKATVAMPLDWIPGSQPLAERLIREPPVLSLELPAALEPVLREYQKHGFLFLANRCAHRIGAVLADDMGLGKTLQVLALLDAHFAPERAAARAAAAEDACGALVVCPASVVSVWIEQAARFCPRLRVVGYAGTPEQRARRLASTDWDVLVANYSLVRNDSEALTGHEFEFVILDEAQQIKNPDSLIAQTVCRLPTRQPLALTGTPLENRLLDLWSIMNFVNPGFLETRERFLDRYETGGRRAALSKRISPVMLRRLKESVAAELPPRTEEVLKVDFGDDQQGVYNDVLVQARAAVKESGVMAVLAALTRLRQVCCHPLLLKEDKAFDENTDLSGSAKFDCLLELIQEIIDEGHSMLVFSQFTSMLELIRLALTRANVPWRLITGETRVADRAQIVQEFQNSAQPEVFLLSLKAAGTGLTLTKADYVVIYDPWWNPAVERQAIDRTHRIGQDKPVMAYRLAVSGSVEEKILAMQAEKAELFAQVMADSERGAALPARLSAADLASLLE